jgi:hypothetical protein
LTENIVIYIVVFQSQALEVCKKLELAQRFLFNKVDTIQNHFRMVEQSLNNICLREQEDIVARATFQEAVVLSAREGVSMVFRLSVLEQARGNIILNT